MTVIRTAGAAAAAALLAATVVAAPAASANPATQCATLGWVGDSLSVPLLAEGRGTIQSGSVGQDTPLAKDLLPQGVNTIYYDVAGARSAVETVNGTPNAVDALASLPAADCYFAAVGTNDAANIAVGSEVDAAERVKRLRGAASGKPLFMMTVAIGENATANGYTPAAAQAMNDAITAGLPTGHVLDWAARSTTELRAADGIHDSAAGISSRARAAGVFFAGGTPAAGGDDRSPGQPCQAPVIALDPGHNPDKIEAFDRQSGVLMVDEPNGAEDADVMAVAKAVRSALESRGYKVVLLKSSTDQSISYRDRVERAKSEGAALGVSIHTSINENSIFPQREGNYREGVGADGQHTRVAFSNADTAAASEQYSMMFAQARATAEGRSVVVRNNSFDGRAGLWGGNIPVIALIAEDVPWVYNEFGTPTTGGTVKVPNEELARYATGLVAGIIASIPNDCGQQTLPAAPEPS
ncbi:N-acetylmuramoyl-L-alanine amidase [Gordonia alkaliphila]|uniref:N-acetylmuramoyl-L-alanine amidase n=1 Tax=Gordonia alkaliphila TaxID=1053547 RepID=UPI001FF29699|nr:N-acetylmuramoyl-L-alanine amidase [Gordonia alkaliphila]MCK0441195.1 N-acetylmuramoyl-L-alanine amidase [Gordonia alkaliphila]